MANITGSSYVLAVTALNPTVSFFTEKLGFKCHDDAPAGWAIVSNAAGVIWIGECPDAVPISQCPDHAFFAYFVVDNATELFNDLMSKGVEMSYKLEDKQSGMREFGVVAPEGHRISFGEYISKVVN